MNEQIIVDKDFHIVRRTKVVNLFLPSDSFGQSGESPNFEVDINTKIDKSGIEPANHQ